MKDLAEIIKQNPGCVAIVDNDHWTLYKQHPYGGPDDVDEDEWMKANELANADDVKSIGEGYGSGRCYGGDILQALAQIVGIQVEGV